MRLGKRKRNAERIGGPLRTEIIDGAPYFDEPVYRDAALYVGSKPITVKELSHYKRVPLRWLNPDGTPK